MTTALAEFLALLAEALDGVTADPALTDAEYHAAVTFYRDGYRVQDVAMQLRLSRLMARCITPR